MLHLWVHAEVVNRTRQQLHLLTISVEGIMLDEETPLCSVSC
jgi:hypothetical protein